MKNRVVKEVKDLIRTLDDNKKRKRHTNIHWGTKERAGVTRRLRGYRKEEKAYQVEKARIKKAKTNYYHPSPVPDPVGEIKAKSKQVNEMYKKNREIRQKNPKIKPIRYGTAEQVRRPF